MTSSRRAPVLKDLVLVGGGHSHVIVLRRFGMRPMPGVRVTVIARDIHAPYSGMLPGLIAGHYRFDDAHIDLGPLTRFAGARLFHDTVIGVDLDGRRVLCRDRPPVAYDVLSIDIGVTPALRIPGAADHAVPVKPISALVARWERLQARVRASPDRLRIGIVGAGAAGVELTLAIQHALREQGAARVDGFPDPEFHLFSGVDRILPTHNRGVRARFTRVLNERGVHVHLDSRVHRVEAGRVEVDGGAAVEVDEVIWATEAGAQSWPGESGLDVDDHGFIRVTPTLEATSHKGVFAVGDVAAVTGYPREKAGVFAVRQGPPLDANLRRALRGVALEPFRPQRKFLSLISTGDRYAVASRGAWSLEGAWVWRWKDWIDRRFMGRFNRLPAMEDDTGDTDADDLRGLAPPAVVRELSTAAMRCGGCGSKVGATVLDRVLSRLEPLQRDDVVVGLDAMDDAAVEVVPAGKVIVRTVDAFRALIDDPFLFGKITANHCLSDLHAMGAEPRSALAIVTVPYGLETQTEALLKDLLSGAVEILNRAGAALVGGHTTEGVELTFGLAVSGVADPDALLRKRGMRPGDRIILTKPLGTGTLFAADMRGRAKARWIDGAIHMMLQSNGDASAALGRHAATACTDVTGFGLLGHLVEMTKASGVDARLTLGAIPTLDGARETTAAGLLSSLQPHNVRLRRAIANVDNAAVDPRYPILFDPQTAGGLLATTPRDAAAGCVAELRSLGYGTAAVIGEVEERSDRDAPIWIDV